MLALVAGGGDLPNALLARIAPPPLLCEMAGQPSDLPRNLPRLTYRLERLGSFLADLRARGVTQLCMAGALRRPRLDPELVDPQTRPLLARLAAALGQGDDGTLRALIAIVEEAGITVVAAHSLAPDLLPASGILTRIVPGPLHRADSALGEAAVAEMGRMDTGQACVIRAGCLIAREGADGTDAMLSAVQSVGGLLFKAPKPGQDRRADLPVIGPGTARAAMRAGLAGIVIESGGVMVLDLAEVVHLLDQAGLFLWVRPPGPVS